MQDHFEPVNPPAAQAISQADKYLWLIIVIRKAVRRSCVERCLRDPPTPAVVAKSLRTSCARPGMVYDTYMVSDTCCVLNG